MNKKQIFSLLLAVIVMPLVLAFNGCTANKPARDLLIIPTTTTTVAGSTTTTVSGTTTTSTTVATSTTTTTTTTTTTVPLPQLDPPSFESEPGTSEALGRLITFLDYPEPSASIYYTTDGSTPDPTDTISTKLYNPDTGFIISTSTTVSAIAVADGYANSEVLVGVFTLIWWQEVGGGVNGTINALAIDDDGNLYVGGFFALAGDVAVENIAMWDGENWHSLGDGLDGTVHALVIGNDGSLYAGGSFTGSGSTVLNRIARWDISDPAADWEDLDDGLNDGTVYSLAIGEGYLYAGGSFTGSGATVLNRIGRWDISFGWDPAAVWESVGNGFNNTVYTVQPVSYGGDFWVVAGGSFIRNAADTIDLRRVAFWDELAWAEHDGGANDRVFAQCFAGSTLYVGGAFDHIGPGLIVPANYISPNSFVEGGTWGTLDDGLNDAVRALWCLDDGRVLVGGDFTVAGSGVDEIEANHIARWNTSTVEWEGMGGINGVVNAIAVSGDGRVYAGGTFSEAGGFSSDNIAVWGIH
jgi:hypothetical protein